MGGKLTRDGAHGMSFDRHAQYDPHYGFPEPRKKKEMKVTVEQMNKAKIPSRFRNYCAHHYINFATCRRDNIPFMYKCEDAKHLYSLCQQEEAIDRFKEFEREKRLRIRAERKAQKAEWAAKRAAAEELGD